METIELHLDPQTLVRVRQLAASRHCTIAVVEVYTTPYEAYDIEIVTDEGKTKGIAEGSVRRTWRCCQRCVLPLSAWSQRAHERQCGFLTGPK